MLLYFKAWTARVYGYDLTPMLDVVMGVPDQIESKLSSLQSFGLQGPFECLETAAVFDTWEKFEHDNSRPREPGDVVPLLCHVSKDSLLTKLPHEANYGILDGEGLRRLEGALLDFYEAVCSPRLQIPSVKNVWQWFQQRIALKVKQPHIPANPIINVKLSGSFGRMTCTNPVNDIDVVVEFEEDKTVADYWFMYAFHTIIEAVRGSGTITNSDDGLIILENTGFPGGGGESVIAVRRQGCSVGFCLGSRIWDADCLKIDVVPVQRQKGVLVIWNRVHGRRQINVDYSKKIVEKLDKRFGGRFRPLIHMLKIWNKRMETKDPTGKGRKPFRSFHLECICYDFGWQYHVGVSFGAPLMSEAIVEFFDFAARTPFYQSAVGLDPLSAPPFQTTWNAEDVKKLLRHTLSLFSKARNFLISGSINNAILIWQEIFGGDWTEISRRQLEQPQLELSQKRQKARFGESNASIGLSLVYFAGLGRIMRASEKGLDSLELPYEVRVSVIRMVENYVEVDVVRRFINLVKSWSPDLQQHLQICLEKPQYLFLFEDQDIIGLDHSELIISAVIGGEKSLKFLQKKNAIGSDLNSEFRGRIFVKESPLLCACFHGNASSAKFLLQNGAKVHTKPSKVASLVSLAASADNAQVLKLLLNHGASPFEVKKRHTPIHHAIRGDCLEAVKILEPAFSELIKTGHSFDFAPIFRFACVEGTKECVLFLCGTEIARKEVAEDGPIIIRTVLARGDIELVRAVINIGAQVEPKVFMNSATPLQSAAQLGYLDICRVLLENGARKDTVCADAYPVKGLTALELSRMNGHHSVTKLIEEFPLPLQQEGARRDKKKKKRKYSKKKK